MTNLPLSGFGLQSDLQVLQPIDDAHIDITSMMNVSDTLARLASLAVTMTSTIPLSVSAGVPENVPVAGSNVIQAGMLPDFDMLALYTRESPASISSNVLDPVGEGTTWATAEVSAMALASVGGSFIRVTVDTAVSLPSPRDLLRQRQWYGSVPIRIQRKCSYPVKDGYGNA